MIQFDWGCKLITAVIAVSTTATVWFMAGWMIATLVGAGFTAWFGLWFYTDRIMERINE